MSRTLKRVGIVLGSLFALVALLLVGAEVWGRRWLGRYAETWRAELTAERQRVAALRMPVLVGEPLDDDAGPRYRRLLELMNAAVESRQQQLYRAGLNAAVAEGVRAAPPPEVQSLLEVHRDEVEALSEAVRCTRCDWGLRLEDGYEVNSPGLVPARVLAQLAILDGHERARAGDAPGAARRYLEVLRFGADFGSGTLLMVMIGSALDSLALESLEALVTTGDPAAVPLAEIDQALARLEGHLPSVAHGMKMERLAAGWLAAPHRALSPEEVGIGRLAFVTPTRAFLAHAVSELDPMLRDAERAATVDRTERARLGAAIEERAGRSWNPLVAMSYPRVGAVHDRGLDLVARHRLVRAAVLLEQSRPRGGGYAEAGAAVTLPADPHLGHVPLRFTVLEGGGYRLWSAGRDGRDDGGAAATDLVLERRPLAP